MRIINKGFDFVKRNPILIISFLMAVLTSIFVPIDKKYIGYFDFKTLSCQITSNIPTAILLSQFTGDYANLLIGVNIGGTGTLIASLASLITFREYKKHNRYKVGY